MFGASAQTATRLSLDIILTTYPLSRDFERQLRDLVSPQPTRLSVAELRRNTMPGMVRTLRSYRPDRIVIPLEDENSRALLPVLLGLAAVTRARKIVEISPDLSARPVNRLAIAGSLLHFAAASVVGWFCTWRAGREVARLVAADRISVPCATARKGIFLNANLWFGVKAGGSVGHISGVVNGLTDEGYSITYASAGGRMLAKPQVDHCELRPARHFGIPWETNFIRFHFQVVSQVRRIIGATKPQFIYQRMSVENYSGVSLSREFAIPLILEYNGSEAWVAQNWGRPLRYQKLAERTEEVCLRHAHLVVTVSDVLRDELLDRGVEASRIVTYPNCIDPETFDPARFTDEERNQLRADYGIAADAVVVAFIGTFGQWHGAEMLASAARSLCDGQADWVRRSRVHFLFIGDGIKMPDVVRALGPHANEPHVSLVGLVPRHLAASDILVSPHVANADGSRFFGSPTKLFEYLASEKAILASDLDQIGDVLKGSARVSELADDGPERLRESVGLLATPGDPAELAKGIRFLVDHPDCRRGLGKRARALALSKFTWQHHVRAIIDQARNQEIFR